MAPADSKSRPGKALPARREWLCEWLLGDDTGGGLMSVADRIIGHVDAIDARNPDFPLLPDDAIALVRRLNLRAIGGLIEDAMRVSGLSMGAVIRRSIAPNRERVCATYPHTERALDAVIRDLGTDT